MLRQAGDAVDWAVIFGLGHGEVAHHHRTKGRSALLV
jgi:hypothetical protein